MTIPRLEALNLYWKDNPPLHVMVAAYFGIGKKETKEAENDNLEEILSMMPVVPYEEKK